MQKAKSLEQGAYGFRQFLHHIINKRLRSVCRYPGIAPVINFYNGRTINFFILPASKTDLMLEEYEKNKRKQVTRMRSYSDYGMGILILAAGFFFLFRSKLGNIPVNQLRPPTDIDKIFGAMCLLYGAWRVYRGYKKNYFK